MRSATPSGCEARSFSSFRCRSFGPVATRTKRRARKFDLFLASECSAETPAHAVQNAGSPLATLLGRGVLVVRCNDARVQCLQSTRDATDVLCTTAPRHR